MIRAAGLSSARASNQQNGAECLDLANPVWGDPILSMANPALFGTISTTRTPMRELQLGVKFSF